ncbi:MAG: molybdenum transporter ATP-binding protein, partial [Dehalococcoidia bacterium]|nr:molybdenum transporter ATP-binding protein [Dehalococcoidia bacterium]
MIALFGPSGAGKTLTLNCISGLVKPDSGRIDINGATVFDSAQGVNLPPQRRRVGFVFQNYALLPHLSVGDNVAFGLRGLAREEKRARVSEMLRLAGLVGLEHRRPSELSGGQQQRVAIARALAIEPSILLLDEPFTALDSGLRRRLQEELTQLVSPLKITTILVTHNLREAYILSQNIAIYDGGAILQMGPCSDVVNLPRSARVAELVGMDNVFRGIVADVDSQSLRVTKDGLTFMTPYYPFHPGDEVDFCIPSRDVALVAPVARPQDPLDPNHLRGRIVQIIPHLGSYVLFFKVDTWDKAAECYLHIEVPSHVYQELGVQTGEPWIVYLR